MKELDHKTRELARINAGRIIQAIQIRGQAPLADLIGASQPTIAHFQGGETKICADSVGLILAAGGFSVVPADALIVDRAQWEAVLTLATRGLELIREDR